MSAMTDNPTAVYIHIPFCHHRCSYCDFNIYAGMKTLYAPYVEAVAKEIEMTAAQAGRVRVPSIYFGGGTPSLLPADLIGKLLTAVRTFFAVDAEAEVTLEANPTTDDGRQTADSGQRSAVSRQYFAHLRTLGINRLSLGVQSSHEDELQLLRRGHSFADAAATYEAARRAGFDNVNVDLIYRLARSAHREVAHDAGTRDCLAARSCLGVQLADRAAHSDAALGADRARAGTGRGGRRRDV